MENSKRFCHRKGGDIMVKYTKNGITTEITKEQFRNLVTYWKAQAARRKRLEKTIIGKEIVKKEGLR